MFIKGKVFGGDTGYTYLGSYSSDGNSLKARVMVRNFLPAVPSVIGITGDFELLIDGTVEGGTIKGTGSLLGGQAAGIALKLTRKADLPV